MSASPTEVQQSVPVSLSITVPTEGGEPLHVTVPLTINLTLSVSVVADGQVASVAVESGGGTVDVFEDRLVDVNGIPYTLEEPGELEILQASTNSDSFGNFAVIGQFKNISKQPIEAPGVVVNLYDRKGRILATEMTIAPINILRPGKSTSFEAVFHGKKNLKPVSFSVTSIS